MTGPVKVERRKAERIEASLNLNVHLDLGDPAQDLGDLETLNVSSSGVYFLSKRYLEPMTKLALSFDVPTSRQGSGDSKPVSCEGIVVRIQPEQPDPSAEAYEVAVFFTTIDAESLHHLEQYIAARLS